MSRRAFGVPRARGPLKIYRTCLFCVGGVRPVSTRIVTCQHCNGEGRVLIDAVPQTQAADQAAATVRKTQGRGKQGRDM